MSHRLRALLSTTLIIISGTGCSQFNGNFRAVEEGVVYRSGQLKAKGLEQRIDRYGITTVISLRNPHPEEKWYQRELAVCRDNNVAHVSIPLSKEKLPSPEALNRFHETLNNVPGPVLIHCQGGVHRAAVGSAIYLLSQGESPETARDQFGFFFNGAPIGELIDLIEANPSDDLGEWLLVEYPGHYADSDATLRQAGSGSRSGSTKPVRASSVSRRAVE